MVGRALGRRQRRRLHRKLELQEHLHDGGPERVGGGCHGGRRRIRGSGGGNGRWRPRPHRRQHHVKHPVQDDQARVRPRGARRPTACRQAGGRHVAQRVPHKLLDHTHHHLHQQEGADAAQHGGGLPAPYRGGRCHQHAQHAGMAHIHACRVQRVHHARQRGGTQAFHEQVGGQGGQHATQEARGGCARLRVVARRARPPKLREHVAAERQRVGVQVLAAQAVVQVLAALAHHNDGVAVNRQQHAVQQPARDGKGVQHGGRHMVDAMLRLQPPVCARWHRRPARHMCINVATYEQCRARQRDATQRPPSTAITAVAAATATGTGTSVHQDGGKLVLAAGAADVYACDE